ncbi:helix-turn-helix domain-containing protein [Actinomadura scrupuli]|uniref:helix-turn-helix domain-containing protein n=1 Tax=Actinomadura scrupuli TaxID=559629 RepID=UPI003D97809E
MARKPYRTAEPASPTLLAFGNQVRHYRDKIGLSQDRLGERFPVSGSYIGLVETGKTRCTEEFGARLDEELGAQGALCRLWGDLVQHVAYPIWFDWPAVEREAVHLESFHLSVVDGLAQTREYAAALLDGEAVEARMARQAILTREDRTPPVLNILLDESVLHRRVGDAKTMREQLEHLIALASRRLTVQIVPSEVHDGLSGSFILATMEDRSEVAYVETALRGMTMGGRADVTRLSQSLASLRANALSVRHSHDLIRRTVDERWT